MSHIIKLVFKLALLGVALYATLILVIISVPTIRLSIRDYENQRSDRITTNAIVDGGMAFTVKNEQLTCVFPPTSLIIDRLSERFDGYQIDRWSEVYDTQFWSIASMNDANHTIDVRLAAFPRDVYSENTRFPCGRALKATYKNSGDLMVIAFDNVEFWLK